MQVAGIPIECTPVVQRGDHHFISSMLCATDVRSERELAAYDQIYATGLDQRDANPCSVHLSNSSSLGALYELLSIFKDVRMDWVCTVTLMLHPGEGLQPMVVNLPWFREVDVLANCFGIREVAFNGFESPNSVEYLVEMYRERLLELFQWHMPILGEAVKIAIIGFGFSVFQPNDAHLHDDDFDSDMDQSSDDESMDDSESDMSGPSYRLQSSSSEFDSSEDSGYSN